MYVLCAVITPPHIYTVLPGAMIDVSKYTSQVLDMHLKASQSSNPAVTGNHFKEDLRIILSVTLLYRNKQTHERFNSIEQIISKYTGQIFQMI